MEEEVNFMMSHLPININDNAQVCIDKFVSATDDILQKQRFITLFRLKNAPILPSFFPKSNQFINYISLPIKYSEFINGTHIHLVSKFYEYFYENLSDLLKVTLAAFKYLDSGNITFFVHSTIPSVFGYFAMGDHDEYAYIFYSSAILQADKKTIEILLPPYFSASNLFPFIQKLHEDVSMFICNDIKLLDKNIEDKNIEMHAKHFTKCIISNLKLLPTTHLNILSLLQQNGFSELDVYSFFIRSIIIPQLSVTLSTSPFYGIVSIFKQIALKSIDMYEVNVEPFSLSKTNSIFEVPRAFKKYGRRYLRFVTSIKDVQALFNVSKTVIELPQLLLKLGEMKNLAYLGYSPILFNVYPKEVSDGEIKIKDTIVFKDERRSVNIPKIPIYERIFIQLHQDAIRQKKFDLDYYDNSGKKKLYENLLQKAKENNLGDEFSSDASDETHDEKRPQYSMSEFSYNDSLEEFSNDNIEQAKNNKTNEQTNNSKIKELENTNGISFRDYLIMKQLKQSKEHAYNFEVLIELLFIQRQVANWHEIVRKNYDICVLSCANDILATFDFSNSKSLKSHQKLIDYSSIFSSKSVICNYCSCRVEYILKEWQNETTNALVEKFGQFWIKNNLSQERKGLNTDSIPKSRRLIFGHSFHIISIIFENIGYVRFFRRYKQIIAGAKESIALSKLFFGDTETVLLNALQVCSSSDVAVTTVLLNASLSCDSVFVNNLEHDDYESIILMQKVVRTICEKDDALFTLYKELYFSVSEFFETNLLK